MRAVREKARALLQGSCRVCPICDGRACAGEVPGMGGIGTGASFRNNMTALAAAQLNMRLIHEVQEPSTAASWLGLNLSMPVIAAPIAGMMNFRQVMDENDYARAVLEGCRSRGLIGCTGDGPPFTLEERTQCIKSFGGHGIPFIKPWMGAELDASLRHVMDSGCSVMGMDIDACLIVLRGWGHPVSPKPVAELAAMIERVHKAGIKFVIKGVMTVADALLAVKAGADGIVVSNHGGRVLDHTPGTARVLPAIAKAVRGAIAIMVDGGVRSGGDVLKMLALGADVVAIGRPVTIAVAGGGAEGLGLYLDTILAQLKQGMILTGCPDIASIDASVLYADEQV